MAEDVVVAHSRPTTHDASGGAAGDAADDDSSGAGRPTSAMSAAGSRVQGCGRPARGRRRRGAVAETCSRTRADEPSRSIRYAPRWSPADGSGLTDRKRYVLSVP